MKKIVKRMALDIFMWLIVFFMLIKWEHKRNMKIIKYYAKYQIYYKVLNQCLRLRHPEEEIQKSLLPYNVKTVAIYGAWELGASLKTLLNNTELEVVEFIDKGDILSVNGVRCVKPECFTGDADAVIVTVLYEWNAIYENLKKHYDGLIVPLDILL